MAREYICYVEENRPLPLLPITTARTFGVKTNRAAEMNLSFYMEESRIIQQLAEKSDCVIVGRCADYVLRHMNPVRLFVYSERQARIARCRAKNEDVKTIGDEELEQRMRAAAIINFLPVRHGGTEKTMIFVSIRPGRISGNCPWHCRQLFRWGDPGNETKERVVRK